MPYQTLSELPDAVKNYLPHHGQEIYRAAFNHAWEEYQDPSTRLEGASREETAHRVAWAAVKHKYEKVNGVWKEKQNIK